MRAALTLAFVLAATNASAQWEIQTAPATADLRGIDNVGHGIAWASGTDGTVLRTTDDGAHWQRCATPPDAEHLDFRGIQAFDEKTAIVMSSGKGPLSRLYKTTDACQTWKLLLEDPEEIGFFDAFVVNVNSGQAYLIGDPVGGKFAIFASSGGLETWERFGEPHRPDYRGVDNYPYKSETLFAASNSVLEGDYSNMAFVTGGADVSLFHETMWKMHGTLGFPTELTWTKSLPMAKGASAGAFSLAGYGEQTFDHKRRFVTVGGDYLKPDSQVGTAAFSKDGGMHWSGPQTAPHGFRSAVAYDAITKTWITVGSNGTDISTDDGRNWRALRPNPALHEPADAGQHWNALSLPFVVGPHGRIGRLRAGALTAALATPPPPTP